MCRRRIDQKIDQGGIGRSDRWPKHGVGLGRSHEGAGRAVCGEVRCMPSFLGCSPLEAYCLCIESGSSTVVWVLLLSCPFQARNLGGLFIQTVLEQGRPHPPDVDEVICALH